jgi:8-oxo-dGTP pyrophosphatase MutT (NUDIX family)
VRAAVLIPIVNAAHPSIVFIQRAQGLRHHAGQIAFPGGRVDETDLSPEDAACREAFEEIGLERDAIEVLGLMQECVVRSGFRITPVLSFIQKPAQWVIDPREVARVFEVPLWDLLDARRYKPRLREWVGHRIECIEYEINNELIWGATAGMLAQCLQLMRTCIDR